MEIYIQFHLTIEEKIIKNVEAWERSKHFNPRMNKFDFLKNSKFIFCDKISKATDEEKWKKLKFKMEMEKG